MAVAPKGPHAIFVITWIDAANVSATLFTAEELADWVTNVGDWDEIAFVNKWEFDGEGWDCL